MEALINSSSIASSVITCKCGKYRYEKITYRYTGISRTSIPVRSYRYGTAKVAGALEQLETETNSWKADKAQYAAFTTNLKEKMEDQAKLQGAIREMEERAEARFQRRI